MRFTLAVLPVLLAATACEPRPQYILVANSPAAPTDLYPGSHLDPRGYRVDAGSYMAPRSTDSAGPMSQAQIAARNQRIANARGRGPEAWSDNGYHYDQWGNLIRVDRR